MISAEENKKQQEIRKFLDDLERFVDDVLKRRETHLKCKLDRLYESTQGE